MRDRGPRGGPVAEDRGAPRRRPGHGDHLLGGRELRQAVDGRPCARGVGRAPPSAVAAGGGCDLRELAWRSPHGVGQEGRGDRLLPALGAQTLGHPYRHHGGPRRVRRPQLLEDHPRAGRLVGALGQARGDLGRRAPPPRRRPDEDQPTRGTGGEVPGGHLHQGPADADRGQAPGRLGDHLARRRRGEIDQGRAACRARIRGGLLTGWQPRPDPRPAPGSRVGCRDGAAAVHARARADLHDNGDANPGGGPSRGVARGVWVRQGGVLRGRAADRDHREDMVSVGHCDGQATGHAGPGTARRAALPRARQARARWQDAVPCDSHRLARWHRVAVGPRDGRVDSPRPRQADGAGLPDPPHPRGHIPRGRGRGAQPVRRPRDRDPQRRRVPHARVVERRRQADRPRGPPEVALVAVEPRDGQAPRPTPGLAVRHARALPGRLRPHQGEAEQRHGRRVADGRHLCHPLLWRHPGRPLGGGRGPVADSDL